MGARDEIVKRTAFAILAPLSYLAILIARSFSSMGRLPADPGYDYVLDGSEQGWGALTLGDPYFHFGARFIALIVSWFPLASQVVALSVFVHLVWSGCALIIAYIVTHESQQKWLGYLSGLLIVTAPHASESGLGNVGNVKWPIIAALITACCSPTSLSRHPALLSVLAVISGFTQPLTILCVIPLVLESLRNRNLSRNQLILMGVISGTLLVQIAKVGASTAFSGQSTKVTAPWDGMGLFWWSGLIGPFLVSLACCIILLIRQRMSAISLFPFKLAFMAGLLSIASYRMGGIADRYFIAPMSLALIAMFVTQHEVFVTRQRLRILGWIVSILVLSVPTVKWFSSGPYLMTPPNWKAEIARVTQLCATSPSKLVAVSTSAYGGNELRCSYILND